MKFVVDSQLPPALARFLAAEFGEEAVHVADLGLRNASDAEVWRYATVSDLVLISKDEDFVNMALNSPGVALIWGKIGNCRRDSLLDLFRRVWRGWSTGSHQAMN